MSIRLKILIIVFGFFLTVGVVFALYSFVTTTNYKKLRISEVSQTVAFESERVNRLIAEMERNAIDLALAGYHFYQFSDHPDKLGQSISVENFSGFQTAVGGGIWFEPYVTDPNVQRVAYYAFFDPRFGAVRHDPDFLSEEYDYHTQSWYLEISANLTAKPYAAAWTAPYHDDAGTNALMTTVGSGIYDKNGEFIGMSTVDWEIQSVLDRLSSIKPTENSFVLLASPRDNYIIANTYKETHTAMLNELVWFPKLRYQNGEVVGIGYFTKNGVIYTSFSRLFDNGWIFSVQIPSSEIFAEIEKKNRQFMLIIVLFAIGSMFLLFYLLSYFINRPIRKLTEGVAELGGGNLNKQLEIESKDEIGELAAAFNKMTVELKASIEQNAREQAEKERIGAELNVATQIQTGMLPCIFPPFPDRDEIDIYAAMIPAKEVGGDFYDFFMIDDNTLVVVIADVSGKGIPAALFMVIAKTLIKNNAQSGKNPKEVFETVNNLLCENNETGMFVTAFMGYLDIPSGRFVYVNAGHNPPLIRTNGNFDWLSIKRGFILAGMENTNYKQDEIILGAGDEIFLYTDGVTEAMNNNDELFGNDRLLDIINKNVNKPIKDFALSVKDKIDIFADGAEQADDITMLVLRYGKDL